jgi:hypothetical protein
MAEHIINGWLAKSFNHFTASQYHCFQIISQADRLYIKNLITRLANHPRQERVFNQVKDLQNSS